MKLKKKILLVDDDLNVRDTMLELLQTCFDVEVTEAINAKEAISIINTKKLNFDLIICDFDMKVDTGDLLHKFIYTKNNKQKFILFSSYPPEELTYFKTLEVSKDFFDYIPKPFDLDETIELIEKFIDLKVDESEYLRVSTSHFIKKWCSEKVDVYVLIGEDNYVKIYQQGNDSESEVLEKYQTKGVECFYLDRAQAKKCLTNVIEKISINLTKKLKHKVNPSSAMNAIDNVHSILKVLGINETTIKIVNQTIDANIASFSEAKELSILLELFKQKNEFLVSHSYLTAYLCNILIKQFSWQNKESLRKLTAAALFQNVSIDSENLVRINNIHDENISLKEKDELIEHPRRSADMIDQNNMFNKDVSELILVHHERPDSSGYPMALNAKQVTPLQALFILCSHFANIILTSGTDNLKVLAQDLNQQYMVGNYKVIYQKFIELYLNDKI